MLVKCTSCGALQEINETQNCTYCGSIIELETGKSNYQTTMKSETGNLMAMAETAIEATNWDEALQYFNRVLEKDITNSDAWLGKGIAIVYTSKIGELKTTEAIAYWKNALKHSANQEAMEKRVAKEINTVVNTFYPIIENHFIQYKDLDNSYNELVAKFVTLEKAQDYATQLDNGNIVYFETGNILCKRVIQIPMSYASSDNTAALTEGVIGAVQQNKYKVANASEARRIAKERKNEIKRASNIVREIEKKYINGIIRINPECYILPSGFKPSDKDDSTIKYVISKYKETEDYYSTISEITKELNLTQIESYNLVTKILLKSNVITENTKKEITKRKKAANTAGIVITVIFIAFIIIFFYFIAK